LIARGIVLRLGLSQLICWGVSYYLVGVFGAAIAADFGWSRDIVYGGFSMALLATGLASPFTGRLIDRYGGRCVMTAGSAIMAAGCVGLALSRGLASYYGAWIVIGVAMRLTLYDAAFAALARIGGPDARAPIAQITLLGGLASTVLWPIGEGLAHFFGWRGAVACYAGFAALTIPLHLAIPHGRYGDGGTAAARDARRQDHRPLAATPADRFFAGALYALIATVANFLNSGMSAHMIGILAGLGLAASASVWIATLRGVGQSLSRGGDVLFARRLNPLTLNFAAALLLPFSFVAGLFSADSASAALAFAFSYGAANGILTITRGTLPLILFDDRTYGAFVGRLLVRRAARLCAGHRAFRRRRRALPFDRSRRRCCGGRGRAFPAVWLAKTRLIAAAAGNGRGPRLAPKGYRPGASDARLDQGAAGQIGKSNAAHIQSSAKLRGDSGQCGDRQRFRRAIRR
jgi:MFS family permease